MQRLPNVLALLLALLCGLYLGLFSCGGYRWHKQLVHGLVGAAVLVPLLWPPWPRRPLHSRLLLPLLVMLAYLVTEAAAASFYPAPPRAWAAFWQAFCWHLQHGPC